MIELTVEEELEEYITRLNTDQKQSLLSLIKTFLPIEESGCKYTTEELAEFYRRREEYIKGDSKTYTPDEVFESIRQQRAGK